MNLDNIQITCGCGCETLRLLKADAIDRTDEGTIFTSTVLVCTNCCEQHDVYIEEDNGHIKITGSGIVFKEVKE